MMTHVAEGCLVCRELAGEGPLPGGLLAGDDLVAVFHTPPRPDVVFLGHLLVTPRRHVSDFAGLSADEAAAIGVEISRWSAALTRVGAMRVYVATIGHATDHLHVHLLPRWPGTPDDVPWHSVDDWPGARVGDFAVAAEMVSLIRQNDQ